MVVSSVRGGIGVYLNAFHFCIIIELVNRKGFLIF